MFSIPSTVLQPKKPSHCDCNWQPRTAVLRQSEDQHILHLIPSEREICPTASSGCLIPIYCSVFWGVGLTQNSLDLQLDGSVWICKVIKAFGVFSAFEPNPLALSVWWKGGKCGVMMAAAPKETIAWKLYSLLLTIITRKGHLIPH